MQVHAKQASTEPHRIFCPGRSRIYHQYRKRPYPDLVYRPKQELSVRASSSIAASPQKCNEKARSERACISDQRNDSLNPPRPGHSAVDALAKKNAEPKPASNAAFFGSALGDAFFGSALGDAFGLADGLTT